MTYTLLPEIARGCLLAFTTVILILYIYSIIRMLDIGRRNIYFVVTLIMLIISYVLYQGMIMYQQEDIASFNVPVNLLVPALLLLFVYAVFIQINIVRWQRGNISGMSFKEAFDKLPTGLAFYTSQGIPIMVNEKMQALSYRMFNRPLVDAVSFWENIKEAGETGPGEGSDDENTMVKSTDGKVYGIKRNIIGFPGFDVFEISAVDISREYSLTQELESKRDKARVLNTRLKALMGTIEYVTMNRELLQLKTALHDNIGQSILIAKRYLHAPSSVDRKRMLDFWTDNISHLINDEPEVWELPYYVISREADRLGIHLNIIGELPDEKELIPVVDAAISVEVGNTLKHADGKEVSVVVRKTDNAYVMTFTNDGKQPESEIKESGGLRDLRSEVEEVGGRMEVSSEGGFKLKIILPV